MAKKKLTPALGRGLDALLGEGAGSSSINDIALSDIKPNPDQPRREFEDEALEELARSIKSLGIVQPITLKELQDGSYMIISGERRWRAAALAGLKRIPAYIRTASDEEMMAMALVENIQREDLNAIEVALAYRSLLEASGLTQEELAKQVGKNRSTISNSLRLLNLPAEIQLGLTRGVIEMGHARTLLSLPNTEDQLALYAETIKNRYSVRQVEERCKEILGKKTKSSSTQKTSNGHEDFQLLSQQLTHFFEAPVQLTANRNGKGRLTISFENGEQLMQIISKLEEGSNSLA